MDSTAQTRNSEALLRSLANLIAEVRVVKASLAARDLPDQESAPFLHRQLKDAVRSLRATAGDFLGDAEGSVKPVESRGLLGRLFGAAPKDETEVHTPDANVEGFQGNAAAIPIPELMGFLANTRKSGVLWVHSADETFMIDFKQGALVHATTDRPPAGQRLGEVLVAGGSITETEIERFLDTNPSPGMLGAKLLRAHMITDDALRMALSAQVQDLFCRLLGEETAVFTFTPGTELKIDQPLAVNVTHLLLESARMSDERGFAELRSSLACSGDDGESDLALDFDLDEPAPADEPTDGETGDEGQNAPVDLHQSA